ncbi:hypothetical protein TNIN_83631, partial [Trichonephila inaurata madagascariensis]
MSTKDIYPLKMTSLPDFLKEKSEKELNEIPERKSKDLQELKEKLENDKVTKGIEFHDDFLTQFLRKNKYDTSRASKNLRNYVLYRRKYPSKFEGVPHEILSATLPNTFSVILPKRCPEGCAIIIVKM